MSFGRRLGVAWLYMIRPFTASSSNMVWDMLREDLLSWYCVLQWMIGMHCSLSKNSLLCNEYAISPISGTYSTWFQTLPTVWPLRCALWWRVIGCRLTISRVGRGGTKSNFASSACVAGLRCRPGSLAQVWHSEWSSFRKIVQGCSNRRGRCVKLVTDTFCEWRDNLV